MKIRYSGPHRSVDLVLPPNVITVERNHTIDVPADTAELLLAQKKNWKRAGGTPSTQDPEPEVTIEGIPDEPSVEIEQEP